MLTDAQKQLDERARLNALLNAIWGHDRSDMPKAPLDATAMFAARLGRTSRHRARAQSFISVVRSSTSG